MRYYLAPMEGVTTEVFRKAYDYHFRKMDKYFTPFLVPHIHRDFNAGERREILPENNEGMNLVPQILTNSSEDFVRLSKILQELGYEEINLNLGCPSRTVVAKGRGSGFLEDPDKVDRFLDEIFRNLNMRISIKTRLGVEEYWEFEDILKVYDRYPLEELIIHPRLQKDYYKNSPNWSSFAYALENTKLSLCYNGDLFHREDIEKFRSHFPTVNKIMIGRGVVMNPGLVDTVEKGKILDWKNLQAFHDEVYTGYQEICSGDRNVLFKMKELWAYMLHLLPEEQQKKMGKKIKKAEKVIVYDKVMEEIFEFLQQES